MGFTDKKEAFFRFLMEQNYPLGQTIGLNDNKKNQLRACCELEENEYVKFILLLEEMHLIKTYLEDLAFEIISKGYEYIDKLQEGEIDSKKAFVAMWFPNKEEDRHGVSNLFQNVFAPVLKYCGYQEPFRVDQKHHNNKIDDEIIAMIKSSRIVLADLTCGKATDGSFIQRGGVYYEAGFAQGLGRPVIWTCHKDCLDGLHFDTRQYVMLLWFEENGGIYEFNGASNPDLKIKLGLS